MRITHTIQRRQNQGRVRKPQKNSKEVAGVAVEDKIAEVNLEKIEAKVDVETDVRLTSLTRLY